MWFLWFGGSPMSGATPTTKGVAATSTGSLDKTTKDEK